VMKVKHYLVLIVTIMFVLATVGTAMAQTVTDEVYEEEATSTFSDVYVDPADAPPGVPPAPVYREAVIAIGIAVRSGIVEGYPDGTFQPFGNVTRGEFVTMMIRLLNLESSLDDSATLDAEDADTTPDWVLPYMAKALEIGILSLDENGKVRSEDDATREDVVVIMAKALGLSPVSGGTGFLDDNLIGDTARGYVKALVQEGLIKGYPDNTFRPENTLTRAEAAILVSRVLGN